MFDEYKERLAQEPPVRYVNVDYRNNPEINISALYQILSNINAIDDNTLFQTILANFHSILEETVSNKNGDFINLFTNNRFIMIATNVFGSVHLSYDDKIYCNRMIYDYITIMKPGKDPYTEQLLLNMSMVVNRGTSIPSLTALGIDEDVANKMVIARYSSFKEQINVMRLNVEICNQPIQFMTEQKIVDIYCALFDKLTDLFEGTMFDRWSAEDLENESVNEVYSTINLAILDLVENLPSSQIRLLLLGFYQNRQLLYPDKPIRFNIYSCNEHDYPRITSMLQYLEKDEKVTIPF